MVLVIELENNATYVREESFSLFTWVTRLLSSFSARSMIEVYSLLETRAHVFCDTKCKAGVAPRARLFK